MVYDQNQLILIQKARVDLRLLPSNPDILVMEFLKNYEINAKPTDVGSWNGWDTLALLDVFLDKSRGTDSIGSSILFASRSQQVSTASKQAAEDWTTWKKWALDHKDFEKFRVKRKEEIEAYNNKLLEKINSKELKKELDNIVLEGQLKATIKKFYWPIKFFIYGYFLNSITFSDYALENWASLNGNECCNMDPSIYGIARILTGWLLIEFFPTFFSKTVAKISKLTSV